jgi:hypothetical protein
MATASMRTELGALRHWHRFVRQWDVTGVAHHAFMVSGDGKVHGWSLPRAAHRVLLCRWRGPALGSALGHAAVPFRSAWARADLLSLIWTDRSLAQMRPSEALRQHCHR